MNDYWSEVQSAAYSKQSLSQDLIELFSDNTMSETTSVLSPSGHRGTMAGGQFCSPEPLHLKGAINIISSQNDLRCLKKITVHWL